MVNLTLTLHETFLYEKYKTSGKELLKLEILLLPTVDKTFSPLKYRHRLERTKGLFGNTCTVKEGKGGQGMKPPGRAHETETDFHIYREFPRPAV